MKGKKEKKEKISILFDKIGNAAAEGLRSLYKTNFFIIAP